MRIHSFLTLALVPAALIAQAPATPDYMAVLKSANTEIEGLLKDYRCAEALQKMESLLPPTLPAFDRSTPQNSMKNSIAFSGLTRLYLTAAKAAVQAGEWEKVESFCVKADASAKVNYENTKEALTPIIQNWTQAVEQAKTYVEANATRIEALKAKPGRNEAEEKEYQTFLAKNEIYNTTKSPSEKNEAAKYLKANQPHFQELAAKGRTPQDDQEIQALKVANDNLAQGPKTIKALQDNIEATKAEADLCPPKIESTRKNLKDEAAEITKGIADTKVKGKVVKETSGPKYEEQKTKYFENVLNTKSNYDSRPNKIEKMNFLFRLRHNVAGTPLEAKVMEVIGRVRLDQDPLPTEKKAPKAAKGKKAK